MEPSKNSEGREDQLGALGLVLNMSIQQAIQNVKAIGCHMYQGSQTHLRLPK